MSELIRTVLDMELIGSKKPVMFVCTRDVGTDVARTFWLNKKADRQALFDHLESGRTFVTFNGRNFDQPLISMALWGHDILDIKDMAQRIIEDRMMPWDVYRQAQIEAVDFDHIDLIDVAPGVMISLKTYAGRMGYKTMVDMPFHHDTDLTVKQKLVAEAYCQNDLGVTEALLNTQKDELALRIEMSETYGLDLRSKSDAQIAEAILKKVVGIGKGDKTTPSHVTYKVPAFIKTNNADILRIANELEEHRFKINYANGSVVAPDFLETPLVIGKGSYQMGVGGLHSTHDQSVSYESSNELLISDFDVASYYPNIMLKAGLIPRLGGNKGQLFIEAYEQIYEQRMAAKRAGNKKIANSLKIVLNGTFGKLGNIYCSFYSPDLMLAVTLTGQLNLLCLIAEIEKIAQCRVLSANTDGIMVAYHPSKRDQVLKKIASNAKRTGFEYEETPYRRVGLKDVNNYIAVTEERDPVIISPKGEIQKQKAKPASVKSKGLYASNDPAENPLYLMKNPTMEVCSKMARDYLQFGRFDIEDYDDPKDFVAIRNVKGGGVQHKKIELVDDWEEIEPGHWAYPGQETKPVKRKSRPAPREVGVGGIPFGRVARWYMTTKQLPPITYVSSGNKVPKTEGAQLCMTLPDKLPADLDRDWYVAETWSILRDIGVTA